MWLEFEEDDDDVDVPVSGWAKKEAASPVKPDPVSVSPDPIFCVGLTRGHPLVFYARVTS